MKPAITMASDQFGPCVSRYPKIQAFEPIVLCWQAMQEWPSNF